MRAGERLRAGRVPVEIRAGIIVGPGSAAYEVVRDLVNHLPLMLTPRWVRSKSSPIALDNLLEYLVRVARLEQAAGKVLDAAGPDYISYEDVMRQYGEAVGKRPLIVRVPRADADAVGALAGPGDSGAGQHRARADRRPQA